MTNPAINETIQALQQDWGLGTGEIPVEKLLELLAAQVVHMLEKGPDAFFQLMYRLDIPEHKLQVAMNESNAALQIAELIYHRQLQKTQSRQEHRGNKGADPDLEW